MREEIRSKGDYSTRGGGGKKKAGRCTHERVNQITKRPPYAQRLISTKRTVIHRGISLIKTNDANNACYLQSLCRLLPLNHHSLLFLLPARFP